MMNTAKPFPAQAPTAAARPQPSTFTIHAPELIARGYSPLPRIIKAGHGRPAINEAKLLWVELHNGIEAELRPGGDCETIKDVASKAAENIARLAALFHAFEHGLHGEIDRDTVRRAGKIIIWHLTEARRFFDGLSQPQELVDAIALDAWLIEKGGAASRDITHYGPNALRGGRWEAALKRLEDAGRVRRIPTGSRGFKAEVNPALLGGRHVV